MNRIESQIAKTAFTPSDGRSDGFRAGGPGERSNQDPASTVAVRARPGFRFGYREERSEFENDPVLRCGGAQIGKRGENLKPAKRFPWWSSRRGEGRRGEDRCGLLATSGQGSLDLPASGLSRRNSLLSLRRDQELPILAFNTPSISLNLGEEGKDMDVIEDNFHMDSPMVPLKQQVDLDKDDVSLRRWKEQLLGSLQLDAIDVNVEPEVKFLTIGMIQPGLEDITFTLPLTSTRGPTFTLRENSLYNLKFTFTVQRNLVSGLTYVNKVWKSGLLVDKTSVMIGTFAPRKEPYTHIMEEEETPSGVLARGSYTAKTKFVDDDGLCYLTIDYSFQIVKNDKHAQA
ncbi:hypothetical protein AXG93_1913s1370 [Marchantia polymorpha subsp. ruderalis]|uniref:Rho GDP-dissociation inhibitor 1 n=3 Tax=Marchantia polymorpha TaxID=3197 RepID=A0A176WKZ3_MARPO|nr:hypothetical protein AXG93_1913s1370 [Marchantia polymorpha subsp. ruderalis]